MRRVIAILIAVIPVVWLPAAAGAQPPASWQEQSGRSHAYDLSRARILVIAGNEFNVSETIEMADCWRGWGAHVEFAGPDRSLIGESEPGSPGLPRAPAKTLRVDVLLSEVDPARYDVIYIAGGEGVPVLLQTARQQLARILDGVLREKKVVAAICHGPMALAASAIVKGRRVTVQGQVQRQALEQAGAVVVDEIAITDGNIITGQWPHLETFAVTVAERFQYPGGGGPHQKALEARSLVVRAIDELRAAHRFDAAPVPAATLDQIVRAATKTLAAPATRGSRAIKFVAVTDQATKSRLATQIFETSKPEFASLGVPESALRQQVTVLVDQAPMLLFGFVLPADRVQGETRERVVRSEVAHLGAACANLTLVARSLGLGVSVLSVPAFLLADAQIKQTLHAPESALLVSIMGLGYPSISGTPAVARPVSSVLFSDRWIAGGPTKR